MNVRGFSDYQVLANSAFLSESEALAARLNVSLLDEKDLASLPEETHFLLKYTEQGLVLENLAAKKVNPVIVDFEVGAANHRRLFGGGKGQLIAKAVGFNKTKSDIHVCDCTAGLGGDAFVLASLGASLTLIERHPVVFELLNDGLERARLSDSPEVAGIAHRISLQTGNAIEMLTSKISCNEKYDVIYLDPMFPERKKSASVKKEMQFFHSLVGNDDDSDQLLELAMQSALYRVVVKRPKIAPFLAGVKPNTQQLGRSSRYDIYSLKKLPD